MNNPISSIGGVSNTMANKIDYPALQRLKNQEKVQGTLSPEQMEQTKTGADQDGDADDKARSLTSGLDITA